MEAIENLNRPKIISAIMCVGLNGELGKDNKLLVNFKEEMQHFRKITQGKCCLFGRTTFDGIKVPLKGRKSFVLTSNLEITYPNATVVHSVDEFLELTKDEEEVMICGGAKVYKDTESLWDKFYLTVINMGFSDADAYFRSTTKSWIDVEPVERLIGKNGLYAKCFTMVKDWHED